MQAPVFTCLHQLSSNLANSATTWMGNGWSIVHSDECNLFIATLGPYPAFTSVAFPVSLRTPAAQQHESISNFLKFKGNKSFRLNNSIYPSGFRFQKTKIKRYQNLFSPDFEFSSKTMAYDHSFHSSAGACHLPHFLCPISLYLYHHWKWWK